MQPTQAPRATHTLKIVIATLFVMMAIVVGFHILLPLLGITIAISATMWGFAISAIIIVSIAILLFFMLTGVALFLIAFFAAIFVLAAIILFPLLIPLLAPLLLLMCAIGVLIKKRRP